MLHTRGIIAICGALSVSLFAAPDACSQEASLPSVDDDGTLHVGGEAIPYSDLASPEAKRNFIENIRGGNKVRELLTKDSSIHEVRGVVDRLRMIPGLERLRKVFPVDITPSKIAGVQTDVITPAGGIAPTNRRRVLINLHGGSMIVGARYGGQMESVPIASLGAIKVITVDYRMAPEWTHPAASEDLANVYRELLKSYRPENVGIYGCSAGAWLAGQSIGWFQAHALPRPGAIGMFGWAPLIGSGPVGDSNYIFTGGQPIFTPKIFNETYPYFKGVNWNDPLVSPAHYSSVLRKFPPTLLISGTRDIGLSPVLYTHSHLVDLGVDAELHVWEGAFHCSFAQPTVDPDVPETRQVWTVITRFFDKHLGKKPK